MYREASHISTISSMEESPSYLSTLGNICLAPLSSQLQHWLLLYCWLYRPTSKQPSAPARVLFTFLILSCTFLHLIVRNTHMCSPDITIVTFGAPTAPPAASSGQQTVTKIPPAMSSSQQRVTELIAAASKQPSGSLHEPAVNRHQPRPNQ